MAALKPAALQYVSAPSGADTSTEAMNPQATALLGLISTLWHNDVLIDNVPAHGL